MDIVGSSLALITLSPLFLAIAVAIKLSSPGPVLFRQVRIGQHGDPFTFLKFRSMYSVNDPEIHREYIKQLIAGNVNGRPSGEGGKAVYKITEDPRVTRGSSVILYTPEVTLPAMKRVMYSL